MASLSTPDTALLDKVGAPAAEGPVDFIGIEHEYQLQANGAQLDFRRLIHGLHVPGVRLDPGDANAYRCWNGLALTCDDAEAEIASPPVPFAPGFTAELEGWAATGRGMLIDLVGSRCELDGYSTHLSVSMPEALNEVVCEQFARGFAPALMMLMDRATSGGIDIRPRPGRLEICGEYVAGARLRSVAAFLAGSVKACLAAEPGPPSLRLDIGRATDRYGFRVLRWAFGGDLYREGRRARLATLDADSITAGQHLELCWQAARPYVESMIPSSDLELLDRMVAGALPLGIEGELPEHFRQAAGPPMSSALGQLGAPIGRPYFAVRATTATWDFTLFDLSSAARTGYACVPRQSLPAFLGLLRAGELDGLIDGFLQETPRGRILESPQQTRAPGLWDQVAPARQLLPAERDPYGDQLSVPQSPALPNELAVRAMKAGIPVADQDEPEGGSDDGEHGDGEAETESIILPEEPPSDSHRRLMLPLVAIGTIVLAVIGTAILLAAGGGGEQSKASALPTAQQPAVLVTAATPLPGSTAPPVTATPPPGPTEGPTATPAPVTATPPSPVPTTTGPPATVTSSAAPPPAPPPAVVPPAVAAQPTSVPVISGTQQVTFTVRANVANHPVVNLTTLTFLFVRNRDVTPNTVEITVTGPSVVTMRGNTVVEGAFGAEGGPFTASGTGAYQGFQTTWTIEGIITPAGFTGTMTIGPNGLPGNQALVLNLVGRR